MSDTIEPPVLDPPVAEEDVPRPESPGPGNEPAPAADASPGEGSVRPEQRRQQALGEYFARLHSSAAFAAAGEMVARLQPEVEFTDWEKTTLANILRPREDEKPETWGSLFLEVLAFQAKCLDNLPLLELGGEPAEQARARLVTDAAIGMALMEELQRATDAVIREGKIDRAKKLSGFRNKLIQTTTRIREAVGAESYRLAETLSGELIEPKEISSPTRRATVTMQPTTIRRTVRPVAQPLFVEETDPAVGPAPSRATPLAIGLVVVVIVWAILILPGVFSNKLPELATEQLPRSPAIVSSSARPPSLFVEVDGEQWDSLSKDEQLELVSGVGESVEPNGYTGVQFRTSAGNTVAQWFKKRGPVLVQRSTRQ